jgi:hypothetical protein
MELTAATRLATSRNLDHVQASARTERQHDRLLMPSAALIDGAPMASTLANPRTRRGPALASPENLCS